MLRGIVGALVGYVTFYAATRAIAFAVAPLFEPDPRTVLLVVSAASTLFAAILGGFITAHIALFDRSTYVLGLAAFVLVGGVRSMISYSDGTPILYELLYTVIGVTGVVLGGWVRIRYRWRRTAR